MTARSNNGKFAKTKFTVLVTGSRNFDDISKVRNALVEVRDFARSLDLNESQIDLVHGNAQGADRTAATIAAMLGFNVISIPADWKKHQYKVTQVTLEDGSPGGQTHTQTCKCDINTASYCKMAGIVRNIRMLDDWKPDMVIAFNRDNSSGTMHTVSEARKRGLILSVVPYADNTAQAAVVTPTSNEQQTVVNSTDASDNLINDDPFAVHRSQM